MYLIFLVIKFNSPMKMETKGKVGHNSELYKKYKLKYFFKCFHVCVYELNYVELLWWQVILINVLLTIF